MILELDCGNTRIKWRLCDGDVVLGRGFILKGDELDSLSLSALGDRKVSRVLVSSVLGDEFARRIVSWSLSRFFVNPEFAVSDSACAGIVNGYQQPEKLGVDRWLAILAAATESTGGCIIADCGTAITVDLVTSQKEHIGGYIAPGLRLMRDALGLKAAGIKLGQIGYPEDAFPGRNTVVAIKAAELAMVKGIIEQAKTVLRNYDVDDAALWITGGDGEWLSSMIDGSHYVEDLVLDGLRIALRP